MKPLCISMMFLLGSVTNAIAQEATFESQAKELIIGLLEQEERMIEGDTSFSLNDILKYFSDDAIRIGDGKIVEGLAALTKDVREDQKAIEDVRADGVTNDRKYKISLVKQLSDSTVIVAVDQTFYFSKDSKTVKSESIAVYVVKAVEGKLLVTLETLNKKS